MGRARQLFKKQARYTIVRLVKIIDNSFFLIFSLGLMKASWQKLCVFSLGYWKFPLQPLTTDEEDEKIPESLRELFFNIKLGCSLAFLFAISTFSLYTFSSNNKKQLDAYWFTHTLPGCTVYKAIKIIMTKEMRQNITMEQKKYSWQNSIKLCRLYLKWFLRT